MHCRSERGGWQLPPGAELGAPKSGFGLEKRRSEDFLLVRVFYQGRGAPSRRVRGSLKEHKWRSFLLDKSLERVEGANTTSCPHCYCACILFRTLYKKSERSTQIFSQLRLKLVPIRASVGSGVDLRVPAKQPLRRLTPLIKNSLHVFLQTRVLPPQLSAATNLSKPKQRTARLIGGTIRLESPW